MPYSCSFRTLLLVALFFSSSLFAGTPPVIVTSADDAYAFVSHGVSSPVTTTLTLDFNANATTGQGALINSLALQGVNVADFAITGGTCSTSGGTTLSSGAPSCTVTIRYTPSTAVAENAQLAVNCSTVGLIGGFSLSCTGATGTLSLLGSVVALVTQSAPALSPGLLTLLAVMLIGLGTFFAARRNG